MSEEKLTGNYNPMDNVEETLSEKSLKWWKYFLQWSHKDSHKLK